MIVGVPKEIKNNEFRVGLTPGSVHACVRKEVVKGACRPVVFVFPELDLDSADRQCFAE